MVKTGGAVEFDKLMELYSNADAAVERKYIMQGIGHASDPKLKVFPQLVLAFSTLKTQGNVTFRS